ncbi:hypothetical protein Misp01_60600 [Microtetraspora sp. NBRC 13810]|uniref:hypothetical protein n=1 Tax=Microtetraspora sp. NBRC 13810 TaxID=3030990 RepID=UPI0024A19AC4|nr:hypothetical protein [Microtetraspora sp. NBRC 13810]GLW10932.1 hypothetical protein Misp01_60600 [Microtetraspora sp. NBRC 13810]
MTFKVLVLATTNTQVEPEYVQQQVDTFKRWGMTNTTDDRHWSVRLDPNDPATFDAINEIMQLMVYVGLDGGGVDVLPDQ